MVTDCQVRRLFMLIKKESSLIVAAAKSGMDEETARKYRNLGKLPSQVKKPHIWRTRQDLFEEVWSEALSFLWNPGIEAKTIFIVHHSVIIELNLQSYRMEHATKKIIE